MWLLLLLLFVDLFHQSQRSLYRCFHLHGDASISAAINCLIQKDWNVAPCCRYDIEFAALLLVGTPSYLSADREPLHSQEVSKFAECTDCGCRTTYGHASPRFRQLIVALGTLSSPKDFSLVVVSMVLCNLNMVINERNIKMLIIHVGSSIKKLSVVFHYMFQCNAS